MRLKVHKKKTGPTKSAVELPEVLLKLRLLVNNLGHCFENFSFFPFARTENRNGLNSELNEREVRII